MKLSIVLSTHQTQFQAASLSGSLEENLAKIAAMGYQGVELAIRDPLLVDAQALLKLTQKFGLVVPAIGTGQACGEEGLSFTDPQESVRKAAIERIKSHIPLAAQFDALIILGLIRGKIQPGVTQKQGTLWLTEAIQECSQAASKKNVRIALEPINRYETTLINSVSEGLNLVQKVGGDNFGLLLDTFHMNIEEPDIESSILSCGEKIYHFHVADSNRWYPGRAHLNFASILKTLYSTAYTGFVSGEFMPQPDALTAAQKSIEYLLPLARRIESGVF